LKLYKNGVLLNSTAVSGTLSMSGQGIGIGNQIARNRPFNGSIDDVMIFNRSLGADEILALYNSTAYTHDFTGDLVSNTNYTYKAYTQDVAGNVNVTELREVYFDATAPTIDFVSLTPPNATYVNNVPINLITSSNLNHSVFVDWDNSLVGWWRMDDYDATEVFDYTGVNNGTITGASYTSAGKLGGAMSFDGVDDYIDITSISVDFTKSYSFNVWVKTNDKTKNQLIIGDSNPIFEFGIYGGNIFSAVGASSTLNGGVWDCNNDEWCLISYVLNGTHAKYYIDSELKHTLDYTGQTGTAKNYIGVRSDGFAPWNGTIDDVMVFNRSLGADEILTLYNSTAYTHDFTGDLVSNTNYTYKAYAQDIAGNVNVTEEREVYFDSTAPTIDFVSPTPANATYKNNVTINITTTSNRNNSVFVDWDNSMVGWWRMDDRNSTHVFDYFGRLNASLGNTTVGDSREPAYNYTGKIGGAFEFDGVDDIIKINHTDSINLSTDSNYSVSFWFKRFEANLSANKYLLAKWETANQYPLKFSFEGGDGSNLVFATYQKVGAPQQISQAETGEAYNDSLWHHVIGTSERQNSTNSLLSIYVDGILKGMVNSSLNAISNSDPIILASFKGQSNHLNGTMDDLMIFNRSLRADEILSLYNSTAYTHDFTSDLTNGNNYTYKAYAQDIAGNVNVTGLRDVYFDSTTLTINLVAPADLTSGTTNVYNFTFNATDVNNILNCSLILDDISVSTIGNATANITSNAEYGVRVSSIAVGSHTWKYQCIDSADNIENSIERTLTVTSPAEETTTTSGGGGGGATGASLPAVIKTRTVSVEGNETGNLGDISSLSNVQATAGLDSTIDFDTIVSTTGELEMHSAYVGTINAEENTVIVTISSDPVDVELSVGQLKNVDLDHDKINDVSVKLLSLLNGIVKLEFKPLASPASQLSVDLDEVVLDMATNSNKARIIKVTNNGASSLKVRASQSGLDDLIILQESSFDLGAGESKDLEFVFVSYNNTGTYTGNIYVGNFEIPVSINVRSKELLFDAMIVVPESHKTIRPDEKLEAQVTLIPMGDNPRLDVTLNYLIKDFDGRIYSTESETILVDEEKSFKKEFFTGNLITGNYVIALELIYPNGVATSSSHFEISDGFIGGLNLLVFALVLGLVVFGILITLFMVRYKKHKKHFISVRQKRR
jgi:hypothetical protein